MAALFCGAGMCGEACANHCYGSAINPTRAATEDIRGVEAGTATWKYY